MVNNITKKYPHIIATGNWEKNGKYCIVESRVHGLFASFYCLLYGIYICVSEGLEPVPFLGSNHHYFEKEYGENIFEYFYGRTYDRIIKEDLPGIIVMNPALFLAWCRSSTAERKTAHSLLTRFFRLRSEIALVIDRFIEDHFRGYRVLGIHYRGRDKIQETAIVPFEEYEKQIDIFLANDLCDKVFFCTDELKYRQRIKDRYGNKAIFYKLEADYHLHAGTEGYESMGLHFSNPTPYLQAKDSLIECYLLSSCNLLAAASTSSFALFATFFRPEIPHIMINA
jgi:hypothetical protein